MFICILTSCLLQIGNALTGMINIPASVGWSCTVSWGYRDDDNPWGDERHLEGHCTVTAAPGK